MARLMTLRQRYLDEEVETSPGYRVMPGVVELLERLTRRGPPGRADHRQHRARRAHQARPRATSTGSSRSAATAPTRTSGSTSAAGRSIAPAGVAGGRLDRDGSIAVGDTPLDVEAGHGAGIRVVSVATGEYSVEPLRAAGGDWVVADLTADALPF